MICWRFHDNKTNVIICWASGCNVVDTCCKDIDMNVKIQYVITSSTCKNRKIDYMTFYQTYLKSNQSICSINFQPMSRQNHERSCGDQEHVEVFLMFRYSQHIWTLRWSRLRTSTSNLLYWSLLIVVGHKCWECFECINGVVMCCLSMHITPNSNRRKQHATSKHTEHLPTNFPIQSV